MARSDATHWDQRYQDEISRSEASEPAAEIPPHFAAYGDVFSAAETAIEIACGAGRFAVWLARHGPRVFGYDVSSVAVDMATERAAGCEVSDRCTFEVADLDSGLPPGEPVDLAVCNLFRDPNLDEALIDRLRPRGVIAIAALSEVGAAPGRFRATAGELSRAFASLETLGSHEGDGLAWFVGRRYR